MADQREHVDHDSKPRDFDLENSDIVLFARRERVSFTNFARYGLFSEQTSRRHCQEAFQWVWFNLTVPRLSRHPNERHIGVLDRSFRPKSGTETRGLDQFSPRRLYARGVDWKSRSSGRLRP